MNLWAAARLRGVLLRAAMDSALEKAEEGARNRDRMEVPPANKPRKGLPMDSKRIAAELAVMLGRINALHEGLYVIARHLPQTVAMDAADDLRRAGEAVDADALASPVADVTLDEHQRVRRELVLILEAAVRSRR